MDYSEDLGDPLGESVALPASWDAVAAALMRPDGQIEESLPPDWNLMPGKGGTCRKFLAVHVDVTADLAKLFADVQAAINLCSHRLVVFHCNAQYLPFMKIYSKFWVTDWRYRTETRFAVRLARNWLSWMDGIGVGGLAADYPWGKLPHRLSNCGIERVKLRTWALDDVLLHLEVPIGTRFIALHTGQPAVGAGFFYGPDISFGRRLTQHKVHEWASRIYLDPNEVIQVGFPASFLSATSPAGAVVWGRGRPDPDTTPWIPSDINHFMLDPLAYCTPI